MIALVWCSDWLNIWKKREILPLIYTKFRSIWIKYSNIKNKTLKVIIIENIDECLCNLVEE